MLLYHSTVVLTVCSQVIAIAFGIFNKYMLLYVPVLSFHTCFHRCLTQQATVALEAIGDTIHKPGQVPVLIPVLSFFRQYLLN